jgi:RNA polymerase sigma-70 factor (ECF subfamily)
LPPTPAEPARDPDAELVLRAGAGDASACALLVDRHLHRVIALAGRMLSNRADAEDVAQEVFLRVWRSAADWQPGKARFSTWLYRVTLNLCSDRLRQRRPLAEPEALDALPDESPGAEDIQQRSDVVTQVSAALAQLPERQREAIVLCHYEEIGNREAADILGISVDALESLLSRARRSLRNSLSSCAADLIEEG